MAYTPPGTASGATSAELIANTAAITSMANAMATRDADNMTTGSSQLIEYNDNGTIVRAFREVKEDEAGVRTVEYRSDADDSLLAGRPAGTATVVTAQPMDMDVVHLVVAAAAAATNQPAGLLQGQFRNETDVAVPVTVNGVTTSVAASGGVIDFPPVPGRAYKQIDIDASGSTTGNCWLNGSRTA